MKHLCPLIAAGALSAFATLPAAHAEPRTYDIDPDHFSIAFNVRHIGYADTLGLFLKGQGSFVYDEQTRQLNSGRVVVSADSAFTNHKARDKHVRDSDFLNADKFPDIVFEATRYEAGADGSGKLDGKLTMLGQTHPVTLDVKLNKAGPYPFGHKKHTLGISARTTIKRSQWGMSYGVERGLVGDEVGLAFELEAMRK